VLYCITEYFEDNLRDDNHENDDEAENSDYYDESDDENSHSKVRYISDRRLHKFNKIFFFYFSYNFLYNFLYNDQNSCLIKIIS